MSKSLDQTSFKLIFEYSPIPLWEMDFTELFDYFDSLKQNGIEDLKIYLESNPKEIYKFLSYNKIVQVNPAVLSLYQVENQSELTDNPKAYFSKKSIETYHEQLKHLFNGDDYFTIETEIVTKNRQIRSIRLKTNIHVNKESNKITGIISTEDITELKSLETQFKNAIALSPDSITIARGSDGTFSFVNETFKTITGFTDEDIEGKSLKDLGMWVSESDSEEYVDKLMKNGFIQDMPTSFRLKSGKILDTLLSAKNIIYNNESHIIATAKDVTDYNRLTRTLKQSEEQFRKAFMNIPDAFQINRISDASFVDVNDVFLKNTGYTRDDLVGKSPEDLNIWVNNDSNRSFYKRLKTEGNISNFETIFRMKDGSLLNVFISANIIELDGEPHIITITKDISKFKEAQNALVASEKKFQSIFSKSPDAMAIMEMKHWTYVDVNDVFLKFMNIPKDEILGKTNTGLNLWYGRDERDFFLEKAQKGEEILNFERLFTTIDGQEKHMLVSSKLIEINLQKHYLLIAKDIEDFVRIKRDLFEKNNSYKAIVSNSYEGIAVIDDAYHIIYANKQLETLTGYFDKEIIGLDFRQILSPESAQLVGERYKNRQSGKRVPQHYKFDVIQKNGEIRIAEIHSSVIKTAEGKTQTIAQILDITEREKAAKIITKEHQRAKQYFEVASMMMVVLDSKGIVTAINKKGCEILETSEKNIVGKNWFTNFFPKNLMQEKSERFIKSMEDEKFHENYFENTIKTSLGKEKIIAWRNSLLKDENDGIIGTISSGEDISDKEEVSRILNMSGMVAILWKNEKDSPIEFISENAETLFGYTSQDFYSNKFKYLQFIHPDDVERLKQETKALAKQKRTQYTHKPYRIITKAGETKWVNDRTTVQYDSEGNISYYYGVLSDITEDVLKGEKLRQSNEILSQMNDGVIITNFSGKIIDWSGDAEKIFGYGIKEVAEENIQILWNSNIKAKEKLSEILNEIEISGYYQKEISCIHKNGKSIPIELTAKILYDSANKPLSLILVNRDITNRKIAQSALEQSERRYRHIFESILDGVIIYNMNKEIVQVNKMATQMYGYSDAEFTQSITSRNIHPVQNHRFKDVIKHLDNDYDRMFEGESVDISKSGKKFFVNAKGRLIDYNNEPHLLIIVRDITKIKQAELDILKAKEKAVESEQLKSAFLANMSHEIRTPMNSIIGFSDLLGDDDISTDEKQHFLGIIRKNGNQLLKIINDIIDVSKIEAGEIKLNYERMDLCETFQDIYNMFELASQEKGVMLLKNSCLKEKEFIIKSDELRLKQILINLVSNALKFTDTGSIEIGCHVIDEGLNLHFYVKDSGIGISKDKQEEIFQRFMQAELKTTKLYGGTGLGLAISLGLALTFKGRMWVESEVGMGSTFNFSIPLIRD